MTYIRTKTIHGRPYLYLVEGRRVKGKVKQRVVKYLGAVNPIYRQKRRKSNAWLFVRKLAPEEQEVLRKANKSSDAFTRDRTRIILFSAERKSCGEIASKLGCDVRKIRSAIRDFNKRGPAALQRGKAEGAPPKFTEAIKKGILKEFSREPRECGYHYTTWTLPRFTKHLTDRDVVESISIETVRQILIRSGARLKRSKRRQYSPDKDFDKKNKR